MLASRERESSGQDIRANGVFRHAAGLLVRGRGALLVPLLLLAACEDTNEPDTTPVATLSGTVRSAGLSVPLADARIRTGTLEAISDANGHFELAGVPTGAATVRAERPGYTPVDAAITITAGANSHDFSLAVRDIYAVGRHAVYVPAGVGAIRGVVVLLGGPVTSAFVAGGPFGPPDRPAEFEQSWQELGANLRAFATSERLALLGSRTTGMDNSATSDASLLAALSTVAEESGHRELAAAPLLFVGISGGSPEAAGFVSRHPERTIALFARVPAGLTTITEAAVLAVPTFVMQAEGDTWVNNFAVQATFSESRSRGGLWALAVESNVAHIQASSMGNSVMLAWLSNVLALRLPTTVGGPLVVLTESSGWLGNQTTLETAPWEDYAGERSTASWLLSEAAGASWRALATAQPGD